MVFIDITQDDTSIILDCHKGSENGEYFQLIIDANTRRVISRPEAPDIDVSAAYSHIYAMMSNGDKLPAHTVSAWG